MDDPWEVKAIRKPGQYVSCMKINGVPLLPPVLSKNCRKEMQYYKLLAKEVEKRIAYLKPYTDESDSDVRSETEIDFDCNYNLENNNSFLSTVGGDHNSGSREGLPRPEVADDGACASDCADDTGCVVVCAATASGARRDPGRGRRLAPQAHTADNGSLLHIARHLCDEHARGEVCDTVCGQAEAEGAGQDADHPDGLQREPQST